MLQLRLWQELGGHVVHLSYSVSSSFNKSADWAFKVKCEAQEGRLSN